MIVFGYIFASLGAITMFALAVAFVLAAVDESSEFSVDWPDVFAAALAALFCLAVGALLIFLMVTRFS